MSQRILLTGASGYLGGTLLAHWQKASLPTHDKLYALVRTDEQANAVKRYGAEPLTFNVRDGTAIRQAVLENKITFVLFLIDAMKSEAQVHFIKALAEVKKSTGAEVHFVHTSGAKIFSSHAGAPTDRPLLDTDPGLYDVQKAQKPPVNPIKFAVATNNTVIEEAESLGVHSYIFVPCIVYGKGEGFGNPISIQTVAIIRAARALRRVYSVDKGRPTWPVCHVVDNTTLYLELIRAILSGKKPGSGKKGYYLASPGSVAWEDIYAAIATSLAKRGLVDDEVVKPATEQNVSEMGAALGCPEELVGLQLGGLCTFTARNGESIGWKPRYRADHIIEAADEEVELVLANIKDK